MSMNQTPMSERVHIGFFGKRNAGKSSVMNAVTGQDLAVVSEVKGTTTDPVYKSMELLPLGPVVMMDTPGIDDEGELGSLRVKKSYQVLNKTDAAVLVIDGKAGMSREDQALLERIHKKNIPSILVLNKRDLLTEEEVCQTLSGLPEGYQEGKDYLWVSAQEGTGVQELKERLAVLASTEENQKKIVGDLLSPGDFVVLVVPIDKAAPKGRLILPQQQTIRDILDADAVSVVVKEDRLKETLESLGKKPRLVITDSQVFGRVSKDTPKELLLTSFSILFVRYKGNLETVVEGARTLEKLKDGDKVLISEGCTHHRQCNDIGTVKLPRWITTAVCGIIATILQILFGEVNYYGLGFLLGGLSFYLVSWLRLEWYTKRLPYFLLGRRELVVNEKAGLFSRLCNYLERKEGAAHEA